MDYAFNDIYPNTNNVATTTELTQEDDETLDKGSTAINTEGRKVYTEVTTIWKAILFFVGISILISFIK
jgi:hypothetical protein